MERHVHIGAGQFGLGFVCWLTKICGYEIVLVNRGEIQSDVASANLARWSGANRLQSIRANGKYEIQFPDKNETDTVLIDHTVIGQELDQLANYIADERCSLVTTSVKHIWAFLEHYLEPFVKALEARAKAGIERPLFVMACENGFSSNDLKEAIVKEIGSKAWEKIGPRVFFANVVVDRVCTEVDRYTSGTVVINAERFGKIFIPRTTRSATRQLNLQEIEGIVFSVDKNVVQMNKEVARKTIEFVDNIESIKRLKLNIVNGTHLLIAINAHYSNFALVADYVRENHEFCERLLLEQKRHSLFNPLDQKIDEPCKHYADIMTDELLIRFLAMDDLVNRILQRFIDPFISLEHFRRELHESFESILSFENPVDLVSELRRTLQKKDYNLIDWQAEFFRNLNVKVLKGAEGIQQLTGIAPPAIALSLYRLSKLIEKGKYLERSILRK